MEECLGGSLVADASYWRIVVHVEGAVEIAVRMAVEFCWTGRSQRSRQIVFSTAPFCQGLCGSQK